MISSLIKRSVLLSILGIVSAGPLVLFAQSADAVKQPYQTGRIDSGTPNSTKVVKDANGVIISYGNSSIMYNAPSPSLINLGKALYMQNCASCHGAEANGVGASGSYPALVGLGPATVHFWIASGRMPAANPRQIQAMRHKPRLTDDQAKAIAAWVNSLAPSYPFIPEPNLAGASVSNGAALYALNCAACHTIEGMGDALAFGTYAPSLHAVPAVQVVEAIRTGPGNMPRFTGNLSDKQVTDIVKFVTTEIQHPTNPGGLGLGGLGPVAEGFIGLALGTGVLALLGFWVGERDE